MAKLDKSRDYGLLSAGSMRFHTQDNKIFDIDTDEEIDPVRIFPGKPETPAPNKPKKDEMVTLANIKKQDEPKPARKQGKPEKGQK